MGPVNQAAEIVPFIHAAKCNSIANANWHTLRQVNIVSDQYSLPIAHVQDESLMARPIIVVADYPCNDTRTVNPVA